MKLTRLDLQRSKGLNHSYKLEGLGPGFNVIVGANGSGKSSLSRSIAALLWHTDDFSGSVEGVWDVGGRKLSVLRESGAAPQWGSEGQPALPEKRFRGCFSFSVDEFLNDDSTDEEIERAIRTELLAGFDLSRVFRDRRSDPSAQKAAKMKGELAASQANRNVLAKSHELLLLEEQKLGEKHDRKRAAIAAGKRVQLLRIAERLATARIELNDSAAVLAEFPASMAKLHEGTRQTWDAWKADGERLESELRSWRTKLEAARAALESTGIDEPVGEEQLNALGACERALGPYEDELERWHAAKAVAAEQLQESRRALKGLQLAPNAGEDPFAELESKLAQLVELESRMASAAENVEDATADGDEIPDAPYIEGIAILGRWLQTGDASKQTPWLPLALASVGVVLGALQLFDPVARPVAWVAAGILIALAARLWLNAQKEGRGHLERDFEQLFASGSQTWQPDAVAKRVKELQVSSLDFERQRATTEERQRAGRRLQSIRDEYAKLTDELESMQQSAGLEPDASRLRLVEVADQLRRQIAASHDFTAATAEEETARANGVNQLAAANERLAACGMAPVQNADSLRAAIGTLRDRSSKHTQATEKIEEATRAIRSSESQLQELRERRENFLADLDLGDDGEPELLRRLDRLKEWEQARDAHRALDIGVRQAKKDLEDHPDLQEYDSARVEEALEQSSAIAEGLEQLTQEIAALENKIEKAQEGHEITDALEEERRKKDELSDLRDELLEGAAADLLLDSIAREHQEHSQHDILRDAEALFAQFTCHRYELTTATYSESGLPFEIRETDGVRKEIMELSSGTRSQLGLALRVAVASSVELGEPLPLVLDEALTNSDPERFREVVRSLNQMVEQGRQIIFLTSDPADAARLEDVLKELDAEPARTYNLDEMRGETRAAETLTTKPIPQVPAPKAGEDADAYAKRLRVPGIDVFAGVDALHLFYLCGGDLEGLHALLKERVDTVGTALHLLDGNSKLWNKEQRAKLKARRDVAAAWLDHYKVGRAPCLHPEVLREGPLGKSSFLEALIEINERLGGNARALIDAIDAKPKDRDPGLKGFRQNKRDELRDDLERLGLFTADEVLSSAERTARCLTAGERHLDQGTVTREELVQLANAFEQWVGPTDEND